MLTTLHARVGSPPRRRTVLTYLCLLWLGFRGIALVSIPTVHAQTYDHYEWFGYYGQDTWTLNNAYTQFINQSDYWINQTGYLVEYSLYSSDTHGTFKLKLARHTANPNEYDVYHTGSSHSVIVGLQNYTLSTHVAVEAGDIFGGYTSLDPKIYKYTASGSEKTLYKAGDLTGINTITLIQSNIRLCMQVLVGWNDPAPPVEDWGMYFYHGYLFGGIGLTGLGIVLFFRAVKSRDLSNFVNFAWAFVMVVIGVGLVYLYATIY